MKYQESTMAGVNEFFQRLYDYHMRHDGTVVGVYRFTNDDKKAVPGVIVITHNGFRDLAFDSTKWKPKDGVSAHAFDDLEDTMKIFLPPPSARNGEDLSRVCSDSLEPVEGSDLILSEDTKTKWDMWIRADCPD